MILTCNNYCCDVFQMMIFLFPSYLLHNFSFPFIYFFNCWLSLWTGRHLFYSMSYNLLLSLYILVLKLSPILDLPLFIALKLTRRYAHEAVEHAAVLVWNKLLMSPTASFHPQLLYTVNCFKLWDFSSNVPSSRKPSLSLLEVLRAPIINYYTALWTFFFYST